MTIAEPTSVASCTERITFGTAQTIATLITAAATATSGIIRSQASQRRSTPDPHPAPSAR
jgi:hypothetical protein